MALKKSVDSNFIYEAIRIGVKQEVERAFDEHKKRLIEQLDRDKDTICSGTVLHMMKYVQMETMRDSLVITIKEIKGV